MRRQNKILKEMLAIDIATADTGRNMLKNRCRHSELRWSHRGFLKVKFKAAAVMYGRSRKLGLSYWHIQTRYGRPGADREFSAKPDTPRGGPEMARPG